MECSKTSNQFLSILAGFIIQTEQIIFRDKLGHQGVVITIKGWLVRPGAAGLLIGIECSRVRDSSWMYLTSLVTTE